MNGEINLKKNLMTNVILSLELSILFISAIFLSELISYKNDILALAYIVFISLFYGVAMISEDKKSLLLKWGLSIPFSYITIQYFWITHYSVRALNWIFPAYGKQSAGGAFVGLILILLLSVLCLVCGVLSCFVKVKDYKSFEKIQIIVISIMVLFIAAAVFILEQQFPSDLYM